MRPHGAGCISRCQVGHTHVQKSEYPEDLSTIPERLVIGAVKVAAVLKLAHKVFGQYLRTPFDAFG